VRASGTIAAAISVASAELNDKVQSRWLFALIRFFITSISPKTVSLSRRFFSSNGGFRFGNLIVIS